MLVLVAALLTHSSAFAQSSEREMAIPTQRMLNRFGLERAWSNQAMINPARDTVRYITVDEENVYVQTTAGAVTGFDTSSGRRLWAVQLGRRDQPSFPAVSNNNALLVPIGLHLYALNKFSGDVLWQLRLPKQPSTSPETDDDQVYIGTLDGSVFAYDLRTINRLHTENKLPRWSLEALRWRYKTAKQVTTPPISTGRVVIFASLDGSLYSVSTTVRDLHWQLETDEPISAPLAANNNYLFLAAEDLNIYCINKESGVVRWEFVSGFPVRIAPRVIGDDIYVTPQRGGLFCLSATSGKQKWWRPNLVEFLAATRTQIFSSDTVGNVVVLSRKDGSALGTLPLRSFSKRVANDRTDRLVMATQRGLVVCIRIQGEEFANFHMFPERRPLLPEFEPEPTK